MARAHEIRTVFSVEGAESYKKTLREVAERTKTINAELRNNEAAFKRTGDSSSYYTKKQELLGQKIEQQKRKVEEMEKALAAANKRYGEGAAETQSFRRDLLHAQASLSDLELELGKVAKALNAQNNALKNAGAKMEEFGSKAKAAGDKMSKTGDKFNRYVTLPIVAGAGYAVKAASDFETAFTGVTKTVDDADKHLGELRDGILEMSKTLPMSVSELAKVEAVAGQLGFRSKDLKGFTEVVVKMGTATNLAGEEGATTMAKFANIVGMGKDQFDRLGSTLVALGNTSATTERDIMNLGQRMAGAGKQAGMSEAEVLGIAAALSSVGIEAEAGGTAFSKILAKMQVDAVKGGGSIKDFARITGLSADEIKNKFSEQGGAAEVFQRFIQGLSKSKENGDTAIKMLTDMGISGERVRDMLLRLSGASGELDKSLQTARQAWQDNTALNNEFSKAADTTAAKLQLTKNSIDRAALALGDALLPYVQAAADWVGRAAEAFAQLDPAIQKTVLAVAGFAAAAGPLLKVGGAVTTIFGGLAGGVGKLVGMLGGTELGAGLAEGLAGAATGASGLLTSLSSLLPVVGPVVAGVGAVTAAVLLTAQQTDTAAQAQEKLNEAWGKVLEQAEIFGQGMGSAKSHLQELLAVTQQNTAANDGLQQKEQETQAAINSIFSQSLEQRRAMSEEDFKNLKNLMARMKEFNDAHNKALDDAQKLFETKLALKQQLSAQDVQESIKTQNDLTEQLKANKAKYYDEELNKLIKHREELLANKDGFNKAELDKALKQNDALQAENEASRQKDLKSLDDHKSQMLATIQDRYEQTTGKTQEFCAKLEKLNADYRQEQMAEEQRYTEEQKNLTNGSATYLAGMHADHNARMEDMERRHNEAMAALLNEHGQETVGTFIGMTEEVLKNGGKMTESTARTLETMLQAYSKQAPDMKQKMVDNLQGMLTEIGNSQEPAAQKTRTLIQQMIDIVDGKRASFTSMGGYLSDGLADGMLSKAWRVRQAASELAGAASAAAAASLEVRSPSRVFKRLGQWTSEGLALGIEQKTEQAKKAALALAETVEKAGRPDVDRLIQGRLNAVKRASTASALSYGPETASGRAGANLTSRDLARAVKAAVDGLSVQLDKREVGRMVQLKA